MRKKTYLCAHGTLRILNMNEKKPFLMLLVATFVTLILGSTTSCKEIAKIQKDALSDSDSVAVTADSVSVPVSSELPRSLDNAPEPKGKLSTWLPAGFMEDGSYKIFILEDDESRFIHDKIGEEDTIYILRLVSYEKVDSTKEDMEEGGYFEEFGGPLVVDAYNPATKAFVGRYEGNYVCSCEYNADGDFMHGGEAYGGIFTKADGTKEDFSFFGD